MKKIITLAAFTLLSTIPLAAQDVPNMKTASKAVSVTAASQINVRDIPQTVDFTAIRLRPIPDLAPAVRQAQVKKIADKIEARMKGKSVGYSFQVAYKDTNIVDARAGGAARRAPDANPRPFVVNDKISIASVSKTITAVTLLKLLAEKNISVDASIENYFPKSIKQHSSIKSITFRELLTHRSGIRWGGEPGHDVLLDGLTKGITAAHKKLDCANKNAGLCYNNANYGLMRILIPFIESGYEPPANLDNYSKGYLYGIRTMQATNKRVFDLIGVSNVYCASGSNGKETLSYNFPSPVKAGQDWGDMTATNAYRGWNLSAPQMSKFISSLVYGTKLMPATLRNQMLSERLGIWHTTVAGLDEFSHGGFHPGGDWNEGEVGTVIAAFSNGISVAMIINSQYGPGMSSDQAFRPVIEEIVNGK